jgi:hypothetical protein
MFNNQFEGTRLALTTTAAELNHMHAPRRANTVTYADANTVDLVSAYDLGYYENGFITLTNGDSVQNHSLAPRSENGTPQRRHVQVQLRRMLDTWFSPGRAGTTGAFAATSQVRNGWRTITLSMESAAGNVRLHAQLRMPASVSLVGTIQGSN